MKNIIIVFCIFFVFFKNDIFFVFLKNKNKKNAQFKINMSSHLKSSIRKYKCDRCDKKFPTPSLLKMHVDGVHLKVKFNCEFCDYQSTRKGDLKKHIDTVHLKLKPFQCDECDQSFGQSGNLKTHVDSVHKKIRFHCSFDGCDKSFSRKSDISTHSKSHEGQVNLCDQRGKSCTTKQHLNQHKKHVHSDARPFQCSIDGCDKSFKINGKLTRHLKQVHGPKQHQCLICLKSFTANRSLKQHIASVHDEIRHQCTKCTKSYSQRGHLQQHIKKEHSQIIEIESQKLPFQNCLWCVRKLPNYNQFIIHAKEKHPKEVAGLLNLDDFN